MDISYRGTNYNGWQIQPNGVTVQEAIENALSTILKEKIALMGSGRTDTGVHATQQVAHFDWEKEIDLPDLTYKLNSFLNEDVAINGIAPVIPDSHARFTATARTYHYHLHQAKNPFINGWSYYFNPSLNIDKIDEACEIIRKYENFECFSKVHTEVNHFNCKILEIAWIVNGSNHLFMIKADRFLRGMVRAIVGTLIDVGLGKTSLDDLKSILDSNDRSRAGRAVPAMGLFLEQVTYPLKIYLV